MGAVAKREAFYLHAIANRFRCIAADAAKALERKPSFSQHIESRWLSVEFFLR
jgi:hypothetical protein